MSERSELSKAIIAAADKDFSTFKDVIGDTLEQRFKDRINTLSTDVASKMFNPEYVQVEPEVEPEIDSETDDEIEPNVEPDFKPDVEPDVEPDFKPVAEPEIDDE